MTNGVDRELKRKIESDFNELGENFKDVFMSEKAIIIKFSVNSHEDVFTIQMSISENLIKSL
ncbi:hypothetical protein C2G38_2163411 [Gigaspora rosea]|uniref:Uncharacterized protein n=1 Tax=Gigaspora rosea TaxID=44941 RepID=A0A397VWX8_9GLOM|nr:hypothetical protein C2G38_2163411 [Gigaspora rosea]